MSRNPVMYSAAPPALYPSQYPPANNPAPANPYPQTGYPLVPVAYPQAAYPPASSAYPQGPIHLAIVSEYPPQPPNQSGPLGSYSNAAQPVVLPITIEGERWDYSYGCFVCQKLMRPTGDQLSVIAAATPEYSPFIRAHRCSRALLPFLLNGIYQLDWQQTHALAAFTNEQELEQICNNAQTLIATQFQKVVATQTKRLKRYYHVFMIFADVLIVIGLIVWIAGSWIGFVAILVGIGIEMVNKWYVQTLCMKECTGLALTLAASLQSNQQTAALMRRSVSIAVGAYGTYLRFSLRPVG